MKQGASNSNRSLINLINPIRGQEGGATTYKWTGRWLLVQSGWVGGGRRRVLNLYVFANGPKKWAFQDCGNWKKGKSNPSTHTRPKQQKKSSSAKQKRKFCSLRLQTKRKFAYLVRVVRKKQARQQKEIVCSCRLRNCLPHRESKSLRPNARLEMHRPSYQKASECHISTIQIGQSQVKV